ncbi:TetR/AcrR family transcriptional regulator [Actinomadura sp. SCN-SB]|uniref:TetR/AcrR family transcriptional regulator n=1 Tax=Actinomadura sp. SCN-SB TaxID=3373092 RepID=UPI00375274B5
MPHGRDAAGGRSGASRRPDGAYPGRGVDGGGAELEETGYAGLTLERVAERSGVHVATLYRRWRNVEGLVVDLLGELGKTEIPIPDTGSFETDLRTLALEIAALYQNPRHRALIEGVIAAALRSPEASDAWAAVMAERNRLASRIVERAVQRGELPPETDGIAVINAVGAPFYYRMLVVRGQVDDALAETAGATVHAGALSGAFTRKPTTAP